MAPPYRCLVLGMVIVVDKWIAFSSNENVISCTETE